MKRIGLLACFWTCCLVTILAQSPAELRDSLAVLNRLINQNPQSTDLRLKKAAVNIELNQWDYAVEEYGRVLAIDPQNLSAYYYRAYAHNYLHRYDLALADYEAFLALMPRHFEAQLGRAMTKKNLGKVNEALDDLNSLVQMFPDSAFAYAARAGFEAEHQQYELALFDWDEALRLQPRNVDFLVSKADVLISLKRKKEARLVLQEALAAGAARSSLKEWLDKCK